MDTTIAVAAGIAVVFIYLILLLAKARRKRSLNRISSKWELHFFNLTNFVSNITPTLVI